MNRKGFSLIEVLLGVTLFALLLVATTSIMISSLRSSRKAAAIALAKTEGAYALQAMGRMIKFANEIKSGDCTATSLTIQRTSTNQNNNEPITYSLVSSHLASNSGALQSSLTSGDVSVTLGGCTQVFTCDANRRSVSICFTINNVKGQDVTDNAGTNGIMFQSMVTILNTKQ